MPLFVSVGEAMIELSDAGNGLMRKGFAGDTFNTAYYARMCLNTDWHVDYLTGLGRDPASLELESFVIAAGIGTRFVRHDDRRGPGLYMIHLNGGERSFSYWRDRSAAKLLADDPARLDHAFAAADLIYLSGITLAILEGDGRTNLLAALAKAKAAGRTIALDPNIRPRLWEDADTMHAVIMQASGLATIVLPGLDDELAHFGDRDAEATIERYQKAGARMIVLKDGAKGVTIRTADETLTVPATPVASVVDSTAAGDSFNAGFLSALLAGNDLAGAARTGADLAARVIGHPGAIIARDKLGL